MGKVRKRLWVTIDTEMDADVHWRKSWPPAYSSVCEGIPYHLRPIWDQYNVHPIYFVSPEVLYSSDCCRVLKREMDMGAVIGAHLHPEYIWPESKWGRKIAWLEPEYPNFAYTAEIEFEKIKNLTELIKEKLGVRPIWYRGARFGADIDTIHALDELGYRYDSSVTPCIDWTQKGGPNHSKGRYQRYYIDRDDYYKQAKKGNVIEVPLTIRGKRLGFIGKLFPEQWFFYRWLRPTHMTYMEMRKLMWQLRQERELVMMFHSMEIMIGKTPYVRSKWMQDYYLWRLRKIIGYAASRGYVI